MGGEETITQDADHSTRCDSAADPIGLPVLWCREFEAARQLLQTEAQQCAAYLGRELEGVLAQQPAMMAGNGSTTGSTRKTVTEQREQPC